MGTMGNSQEKKINIIAQNAIEQHIFPGCAILVSKDGKIINEQYTGRLTYPSWSPPVSQNTVYDLASLTKPLATAAIFMALVSDKAVKKTTTLASFYRCISAEKRPITIKQLLEHSSGLPAHKPYFKALSTCPPDIAREKIVKWILEEPLCYQPGTQAVYSDLGYILLSDIANKITGMPYKESVARYIFSQAGTKELKWGYKYPSRTHDTAPSEFCPYRKRVICRETHDMNAWVTGGVAGHAGLFGTAIEIFKLIKHIIDIMQKNKTDRYLKPDTISDFLNKNPKTGWTCGFDTPAPHNSAAGNLFSAFTIGHLGFTGTSFWHDIHNDITVVMLTNRTFPKALREKATSIRQVRHEIHNAAAILAKHQTISG